MLSPRQSQSGDQQGLTNKIKNTSKIKAGPVILAGATFENLYGNLL